MSIAAAQHAKFKEQVVREGRVFTFVEEGYLVYKVHQRDVIPFWSSRSRLEIIQKRFPKYGGYQIEELGLQAFLDLLATIAKDSIHIGVNWSGERLTGYDFTVTEIIEGLEYWKGKLGIT